MTELTHLLVEELLVAYETRRVSPVEVLEAVAARIDAVEAGEVADVVWTSVLFATVFALISMGIGTVMRSNGPAIAISLVFFLGFTPLLLLVDRASPTLGDLMLPDVLDRLTGADTGQSIPVSAVGLGVWVGVFWAAGRLRVQRDEY